MKSAKPGREIPYEKLRWRCSPHNLGFKSTRELKTSPEIIGQPRALAALRLGLEIQAPGYNIFVVGLTGTGKTTTIQHALDTFQLPGKVPDDLCYVHNFDTPDAPLAMQLPAGMGRALRRDVCSLIDQIRRQLSDLADSDDYQTGRRRIIDDFQQKSHGLVKAFEAHVQAQEFQLVHVQNPSGERTELQPVVAGEPMPLETIKDLSQEGRFSRQKLTKFESKHKKLSEQMEAVVKQGRAVDRELRETLRTLDIEFAKSVLACPLEALRQKYAKFEPVLLHLKAIEEDFLNSLFLFRPPQETTGEEGLALRNRFPVV